MALCVGVPREVKSEEGRVAITSDGVRELVAHEVEVLIESGAGDISNISDEEYEAVGATIIAKADEVWERAGLICKVKEPQPEELKYLRQDLVLFTFLHLAAYPEVAKALLDSKACGIAYETVQRKNGSLPLLAPMSEVAGRMSIQVGARFLEAHNGGLGVLLGGVPGVRPGRVVIIGAGNVGWNAAVIAAGMEAEVHILDKDLDRLRWVDQIHRGRMISLASNRGSIETALEKADLIIGAVLVAGGRAPVVINEDMVKNIRPGAVIVDTAVDQGGCVETIKETSHTNPVYECHGVIHYAVGNMPGAVPHTSTRALTNATMPYLLEIALKGYEEAASGDSDFSNEIELGINTENGAFVNPVVAEAFGAECAVGSWA